SRALFAVRPGFVPFSAKARSWTQSRNSRISLCCSASIGGPLPHCSHFRTVEWYSLRVPRDRVLARRWLSTASLKVVDMGRLQRCRHQPPCLIRSAGGVTLRVLLRDLRPRSRQIIGGAGSPGPYESLPYTAVENGPHGGTSAYIR